MRTASKPGSAFLLPGMHATLWRAALLLLAGVFGMTGCGAPGFWPRHFQEALTGDKAFRGAPAPPRGLPMFDGRGGLALDWADLLEAVRQADVVIVGETHTDAAGHQVQLALVEDALKRWPGSALSLEMLDRSHQPAVNDLLGGKLCRAGFIKLCGVADWAGKGTWEKCYQPLIEAAKAAGARVVAANAPRKYAEVARTKGSSALRQLPEAERALFDLPAFPSSAAYGRRFRQQMQGHAAAPRPKDEKHKEPPRPAESPSKPEEGKPKEAPKPAPSPPQPAPASAKPDEGKPKDGPKPAEPPAKPEEGKPKELAKPTEAKKHPPALTSQAIARYFRAQELWDATMAASILAAAKGGAPKVIHIVGQFHTDNEGGLVQRLRRADPGLTILTISLQPCHSRRLRAEDRGRADVVVYTGGG